MRSARSLGAAGASSWRTLQTAKSSLAEEGVDEVGIKETPVSLADDEVAHKDHLAVKKACPRRFAEYFDSALFGLDDPNFGKRREPRSLRAKGA